MNYNKRLVTDLDGQLSTSTDPNNDSLARSSHVVFLKQTKFKNQNKEEDKIITYI
jgi:hypothetical protein